MSIGGDDRRAAESDKANIASLPTFSSGQLGAESRQSVRREKIVEHGVIERIGSFEILDHRTPISIREMLHGFLCFRLRINKLSEGMHAAGVNRGRGASCHFQFRRTYFTTMFSNLFGT
jgi:hypothetical protein